MEHEFAELSYLVRHAPVDIVLRNKRLVWMNDRWYFSENDKLTGESVHESQIDKAFKWLVNDWWIEAKGHQYQQ